MCCHKTMHNNTCSQAQNQRGSQIPFLLVFDTFSAELALPLGSYPVCTCPAPRLGFFSLSECLSLIGFTNSVPAGLLWSPVWEVPRWIRSLVLRHMPQLLQPKCFHLDHSGRVSLVLHPHRVLCAERPAGLSAI